MRTVIRGMGKYLPEKEYTSEEIEERAGFKRLGIKQGLVRMLTGCETRHYAADDEWCSDIAAKAGAEAIKDAGLAPSDIDAVIFGAITRDFAEPATVNRVVQLLGIPNCYAFDIFNACNAALSVQEKQKMFLQYAEKSFQDGQNLTTLIKKNFL